MKRRSHILALATIGLLAAGGCSGTAEPADPGADAGGDTGGDANSFVAPTIAAGLYNTDEDAPPDEAAALAVWEDGEQLRGRLAVGGDRGFAVEFGDVATLTPLDGACASCPNQTWDLVVEDVGDRGVRLTVAASDLGPGFNGLIMVPHDGFKPEIAPLPGADVWIGKVVALSGEFAEQPIVDSRCELSVGTATSTITSFSCRDVATSSPWIEEVATSWESDANGATFETVGARFEGSFEGGEDFQTFVGRVVVEGEVAGVFDLAKLTP